MEYLQTGQFFGETNKTLQLDGITLTDTEYTIKEVGWHYHENPYFTFIIAGSLIEGSKNETITCPAGTLLFHNWQEPHFNIKPEGFTRGFQLELAADWFDRFDLTLDCLPSYLEIKDPHVNIIFHKIFKESTFFDRASKLAIESLLLEIFSNLAYSRRHEESGTPAWARKLKEILIEETGDSIELSYLAKELSIHPVYLSRSFRKYFNSSFGEYIRNIRIKRSLSLMRNRNLNLTEISHSCGFSDQSHFTRSFKSLIGTTPKEYRKLL